MAAELVEQALAGNRRALSRLLTQMENGTSEGKEALRLLYPHCGRAHVVGVTGPSGSGKSTLVAALAAELSQRGLTIGIVAVDPSSPFTHGALLGDRIRMQALTANSRVFIRSVASRGSVGGLSATAADIVAVLDAAGREVVLVETVGAGQDEVDVAAAAYTTIVVSSPGAGDEIQALKAGILEIADILVINKADHPGVESLESQLRFLLSLAPPSPWTIPLLKTVAPRSQGIDELADAIFRHRRYLEESGRLEGLRQEKARQLIMNLARNQLLQHLVTIAAKDGYLESLVQAVAQHELDPHTAAARLLESLGCYKS